MSLSRSFEANLYQKLTILALSAHVSPHFHIFKAATMKFGVRVQTGNTLTAPNFVKKNCSGDLSLMGKF